MIERPRRLRATPAMRRLVAETRLHPADLVLPLFVREGASAPVPISSMPGVFKGMDLHFGRSPRPLSLERYDHVPPGGGRFDVPDHLLRGSESRPNA